MDQIVRCGMYVILGYVFIAFFVGGGYYVGSSDSGSFWGDAFVFGLGWPSYMAQFVTG